MQGTRSTMFNFGWPLVVALILLVIIAAVLARIGRTEHAPVIPWAAVRATVQLLILGLVLDFAVSRAWAVVLFLIAITLTAAETAHGRIRVARVGQHVPRRDRPRLSPGRRIREILILTVPVGLSPFLLVGALLLSGILDMRGLAVIPVAGILIGHGMAVSALTGRRVHEELRAGRGEVEAALSLGFTDGQARMLVAERAASAALVPTIDTTKTVGMVTIPGAFVGMVLGGATPLEAGIMQLFVIIAILAVATAALTITEYLVVWRLL
ncbi:ABC transporter permease [Corynebacterium sp. P5875]|uniref:ABC transporter permease n=1 Tax=Corynebacterium antarcticum TaxID=2800405 RepID=A0A9Q4GLF1_9CORY|nr:ABC transporter permease [Corynebacterium antarcticum]MCX7538882.1 ABC transporter permease [Corynebacterium antarcticum]